MPALLPSTRTALLALACAAAAIPAAGCGGADGGGGGGASSPNATPPPPPAEIAAAQRPTRADFPATSGRTLRQLADSLYGGGPEVAPATTDYTPGRNRIAFGLIEHDGTLVWGKAAVYVARGEHAPARGPYLAPADSLQVRPAFRSETSAGDEAPGVYHADVVLPRPGRWLLLVVVRSGEELLGGATTVAVRRSSPVPAVGDTAPRVQTPTLASVGGDVAQIDTRVPPDDLHDVDLADVLGRRPVALLFATPALCRSRVCGPVADEAVQLAAAYGDRVAFIHNEVYVDNDAARGLRPQLRAFGLTSEPWLFAIDRHGRIAARLEGAFGIDEFRAALEAALRGAPDS
jgi:hypothetical protein